MDRSNNSGPSSARLGVSRRAAFRHGGVGLALGLGLRQRLVRAAQPATPVADPPLPLRLPAGIAAVMRKPRYAQSTWSLLVADAATGETLYAVNPDRLVLTGSVRKLFSVGLALDDLGADHRFETPVYRLGTIDEAGVLTGDLVLVAAGDLTLGGRLTADGGIAFTAFDHNDANNLGTAILTPQDPLRGLDDLARQVRAAGVRSVAGGVVVDDRLFDRFRSPNQDLLVTPMMVNENMIDVTVTPTLAGEPAALDWRPRTAAFTVTGDVTTSAAGRPDTVTLSGDGRVTCVGTADCAGTVGGDIPVGYRAPLSGEPALVRTFRIEDPAAFARTAFIEALDRAGVAVAAPPVGPNPAATLPAPGSYAPETELARFVSPPFAETATLILKVSLNLGANLSLMLFGLRHGQRTVAGALAAERRTLVDRLGLPADGFDFPTNGSGSPDSRATAQATVRLLTQMAASDVAAVYHDALPVLGVDGSLAGSGVGLPALGHVFAKTGTTLADGALKAQNLAGYIDARSGRRLAFALFLNDAGPIQSIADVSAVFEDEAAIANAIHESA